MSDDKFIRTESDGTKSASLIELMYRVDSNQLGSGTVVDATLKSEITQIVESNMSDSLEEIGVDISNITKKVSSVERKAESISVEVKEHSETIIDQSAKLETLRNSTIEKVDTLYATHDSPTVAPDKGWSTVVVWDDNKYTWMKVVTTATDGTTVSETEPTCITPATGKGLKSLVEQYYLSTSDTECIGGSWQNTQPTWESGKYLWMRTLLTLIDGTETTTEPILANTINSALADANTALSKLTIVENTVASLDTTSKEIKAQVSGVEAVLDSSVEDITELQTILNGTIDTIENLYIVSDNPTNPPNEDANWVDSVVWEEGKYTWFKAVTTYKDGTVISTEPVCITGAKGNTGVGLETTIRYYLQTESDTLPSVPSTYPPPTIWKITEPEYVAGTYLYTVDVNVYSSGDYWYSAVSKSSSYTASSQANQAIEDLKIGGVNLLQHTRNFDIIVEDNSTMNRYWYNHVSEGVSVNYNKELVNNFTVFTSTAIENNTNYIIQPIVVIPDFMTGATYTFSGFRYGNNIESMSLRLIFTNMDTVTKDLYDIIDVEELVVEDSTYEGFHHFHKVFKCTDEMLSREYVGILLTCTALDTTTSSVVGCCKLKLEEGNKPTSWSSSIYDNDKELDEIHNSINTVSTTVANLNIEKDAINASVTEIVGRLDGADGAAPIVPLQVLESTFNQNASGWNSSISALQTDVTNINDGLSAQKIWMDFTLNGLRIGKSESAVHMNIDNDSLDFLSGQGDNIAAQVVATYRDSGMVAKEVQATDAFSLGGSINNDNTITRGNWILQVNKNTKNLDIFYRE